MEQKEMKEQIVVSRQLYISLGCRLKGRSCGARSSPRFAIAQINRESLRNKSKLQYRWEKKTHLFLLYEWKAPGNNLQLNLVFLWLD
uniref:Uncharacterized protein n=1 Tax=Setaria italica TaxID=4555 RepID=K3YKI8_SETIT